MDVSKPTTTLLLFLAFLPILLLVAISLIKNVRLAAIISFITTTILFLVWQATLANYVAALISSIFATVNILMIVFGAVFLYQVMHARGYIADISQSISQLHSSRDVQFFLISFGLTGFFEGVAGFGTPGAIVPLLLIALGFQPLVSIASVLLFDGLFAAFGAVGTPLITGLQLPLSLTEAQVIQLSIIAAIMLAVSGFLMLFFVERMYTPAHGQVSNRGFILILYSACIAGYIVAAAFVPEFASILSSLLMLLYAILVQRKKTKPLQVKPWLPYLFLVILLLLPKLFSWLEQLLDWKVGFTNMFSSGISAFIKPLKSLLLPFVLVGILVGTSRQLKESAAAAGKKLVGVALLLFPVIGVAQLMLYSGKTFPSMVSFIAEAVSNSGAFYPLLAPVIGITGAFITGSTTLSNVVFGASQLETAKLLAFDPVVTLSLQHTGASIGNAVCLFNIITACYVAAFKDTNRVLMKNLLPAVVAGAVCGLLALLFINLIPGYTTS